MGIGEKDVTSVPSLGNNGGSDHLRSVLLVFCGLAEAGTQKRVGACILEASISIIEMGLSVYMCSASRWMHNV